MYIHNSFLKINLRHGLDKSLRLQDVTCTACAGTHLLEFAALSRLTGNHTYEVSTLSPAKYMKTLSNFCHVAESKKCYGSNMEL